MIFLFAFVFALCDAKPGYSDTSYSGNDLGHGSSGGGGGDAYGYAGSFSGAGGFPQGNIPSFVPFIPQFDFSSFFEQLNRQHQTFIQHGGGGALSYSIASSNSGGSAQARSSITDTAVGNGIQKLAEGQEHAGSVTGPGSYAPGYQNSYQGSYGGNAGAAGSGSGAGGYGGGYGVGNRGGFVGGYGGGYSGPDGNSYSFSGPIGGPASGTAYASGSIGPGGVHQAASVYPENPSAPNVNTRFGGESSGGGGGGDGGFKSVFTSSKSVSTNVNGKPQTFRQASTTVNDNGKVTTYTAHNP